MQFNVHVLLFPKREKMQKLILVQDRFCMNACENNNAGLRFIIQTLVKRIYESSIVDCVLFAILLSLFIRECSRTL